MTKHTCKEIIIADRIEEGRSFKITTLEGTGTCPICQEERKARKKAEEEQRERHLKQAEPLECDNCKKQIGYVYVGDLEGSYFYCEECKEKGKV